MPSNKKELTWKVNEKGCHVCTSHAPNGDGYPQIWRDGRQTGAHRYVWEQANGPVPAGMCVCHHCDNTMCIRLSCLFLGTNADNVRDKIEKGRARGAHKGEAHHSAKLTDEQVCYIREHTEIDQPSMADLMGVLQGTISAIRLGKKWKHL